MEKTKLEKKYYGKMSATYEALRIGTPQWEQENNIVTGYLRRYSPGTSILDVPVGTGRFLDFYVEQGFTVTGLDISSDMLAHARDKAAGLSAGITLQEGSIFSIAYPMNHFDVSVCIRFMDWVGDRDLATAMAELVRVTRTAIVVYVPTYFPFAMLGLPSPAGFVRLLRQLKMRFYKFRRGSDSVIHERAAVLRTFSELGLKIIDKQRIDKTEDSERRGYERDIYLLELRSPQDRCS
jgi:ubiquinone/menaquinone biosynthesis C-methylase UbiE